MKEPAVRDETLLSDRGLHDPNNPELSSSII